MGAVPVAIAVLSTLLILLLALPIGVAFQLEGSDEFDGQITICWLFGLVRFRIPVPGAGRPPPDPSRASDAAKLRVRPGRRGRRGRRANVVGALRQAAFRRRVLRMAADLVRATHLHRLHLRMRLGLGDPADTGRLWAIVGPLTLLARNLRDADVQIEPEFIDAVFEFEARGRLRLIPLQLLALAIGFALSPASIRAWRTLWGSHA